MKKYKTDRYKNLIDEVEISRETEQSIFFVVNGNERRQAKRSGHDNYFDAWEEAHDFILQNAERELLNARRCLELAQAKVGNIKGMKKPAQD